MINAKISYNEVITYFFAHNPTIKSFLVTARVACYSGRDLLLHVCSNNVLARDFLSE